MSGWHQQQLQCDITLLSPVHMGTGEEYEPMDYVMHEEGLSYHGRLALVEALPPVDLKNLANMAKHRGSAAILAMQKEVVRHREKLLPYSRWQISAAPGTVDYWQRRLNGDVRRERDVLDRLAIARTARNEMSGAPYLPGSGIKGALRTALLDYLNQGRDRRPHRQNNREFAKAASNMEKELLDYQQVTQDPMRLIRVSDARWCGEQEPAAELVLQQSLKRGKPSVGTRNGMLEVLAPYGWRDFSCTLTLLNRGEPESRPRNVENIPADLFLLAQRSNAYHLPLLEAELELLAQHGYTQQSWVQGLQRLVEGEWQQPMQQGRLALIRLGRYAGAESKTLEGTRAIKILGQKGAQDDYRNAPTELRLAGAREKASRDLLPFGWALLHLAEEELPHTRDWLAHQKQPREKRLEGFRRQLREQQARADAEAARQAERQARQDKAEREAQEREEKLALLSEAEKAVALLEERMAAGEGKGAGPGHALAAELAALIDEALGAEWSDAERGSLQQLGKALYTHLGVDWRKNKKARERLRRLEGQPPA